MPRTVRPIRIEGDVAYVPLTKGYEAVIDAADVPLVEGYNWRAWVVVNAAKTRKSVYAHRSVGGKSVLLHRTIVDAPSDKVVDHRDGDPRNNRRANLRICSMAENQKNVAGSSTSLSGVKGVWFHKSSQKWAAEICTNWKRKHLGTFRCRTAAALAYAKASAELHGEFGRVA